jgi:hypothetical protein
MAHTIKNTPIICSQDAVFLCWKLTPSGKCSSKSAYRACLENLQDHGEPRPRQVHPSTKQLCIKSGGNKKITPRVQTFGWRLLRKAIPTGACAGKYSKHISRLCCRCGIEENDFHLFFLCGFAKAAWFSEPWYLRIDTITASSDSITQVLNRLLKMNHPHTNIENILTIMWCIWKARNDCLFNRKESHPKQINHMANAIHQNLEMLDVLQDSSNNLVAEDMMQNSMSVNQSRWKEREAQHQEETFKQGETIRSDLAIQGSKFFADAAWKTKKAPGSQGRISTGIGVYGQIQQGLNVATSTIQASTTKAPSSLHAEASALLLAARIAEQLQTHQVTFFTDNLTLARACSCITKNQRHSGPMGT